MHFNAENKVERVRIYIEYENKENDKKSNIS